MAVMLINAMKPCLNINQIIMVDLMYVYVFYFPCKPFILNDFTSVNFIKMPKQAQPVR